MFLPTIRPLVAFTGLCVGRRRSVGVRRDLGVPGSLIDPKAAVGKLLVLSETPAGYAPGIPAPRPGRAYRPSITTGWRGCTGSWAIWRAPANFDHRVGVEPKPDPQGQCRQ